ncbi:MAG: hypothetical protein IJ438_04315 [Clostridia bacterium]|nr:hypothetical protein [Clostridia bacterium]
MKLTDLRKQLNTMDKADLIALICRLYKGSKQSQSMIDIELCGDAAEDQLAMVCMKQIHTAFFGNRLSLKTARKVISDFKKVSRNQENVAELMLTYVECGVEFTNVYGDMDEAFYYSVESMFMDYVTLLNSMEHDGCYKKHAARIAKVCYNASDIGWGFSEEMAAIYHEIQWRQEDD